MRAPTTLFIWVIKCIETVRSLVPSCPRARAPPHEQGRWWVIKPCLLTSAVVGPLSPSSPRGLLDRRQTHPAHDGTAVLRQPEARQNTLRCCAIVLGGSGCSPFSFDAVIRTMCESEEMNEPKRCIIPLTIPSRGETSSDRSQPRGFWQSCSNTGAPREVLHVSKDVKTHRIDDFCANDPTDSFH